MTHERKLLDDLICGLLVEDQWETESSATAMLSGPAAHVLERASALARCSEESCFPVMVYYIIDGVEVEVSENNDYTLVSVAAAA